MLSLFKFYIINSLYVALITAHGAQRLLFVLLCRADHRRTSLGAAFRRPFGPRAVHARLLRPPRQRREPRLHLDPPDGGFFDTSTATSFT